MLKGIPKILSPELLKDRAIAKLGSHIPQRGLHWRRQAPSRA